MPRSMENLLMSFEEIQAAETCSNQTARRTTPLGPLDVSPQPDLRNSFSSRPEAEAFAVKQPGHENSCSVPMPDNFKNPASFGFAELAQQAGGARFSFTAGASRPTTMYNESDWVTEPDSLPDLAPRTNGYLTASGSFRPYLPVRPNCLVAKRDGSNSTRRVGSTHIRIGIDGVPPVPRIDYAAHAAHGEDHLGAGQKRLYSERDEPQTPTIRVIKHNHTIPMPGSLTSPQRAFSNSRDELTYPSLAPEDLHVVKRRCSRMTDSNRTASTNVTVIRHFSPQVPPSDITDASNTGTVIVRVPIQQHAQHHDGERDMSSSFAYGSTPESSSRILPSSPPEALLRAPLLQRTHKPSPISVPPRTTFMPADIMATRSPLEAIVPGPVAFASSPTTTTHAGGGDVSRDNSGRGALGRGNGKTGSLLKRMGTMGKSVRVSEWLATVRSRSGRMMTSASTALHDVQLPLHLPTRSMTHAKNSHITLNSRNQLFGSQIMTDIGLASQPSTTALENPFLYTKSRCKAAILYRIVLGLILVPGLGFVVGVCAVKGYLDKMVAFITKGDIKSFTQRQKTVMVRFISWAIVFTISASALAILAVLFLKAQLEQDEEY